MTYYNWWNPNGTISSGAGAGAITGIGTGTGTGVPINSGSLTIPVPNLNNDSPSFEIRIAGSGCDINENNNRDLYFKICDVLTLMMLNIVDNTANLLDNLANEHYGLSNYLKINSPLLESVRKHSEDVLANELNTNLKVTNISVIKDIISFSTHPKVLIGFYINLDQRFISSYQEQTNICLDEMFATPSSDEATQSSDEYVQVVDPITYETKRIRRWPLQNDLGKMFI